MRKLMLALYIVAAFGCNSNSTKVDEAPDTAAQKVTPAKLAKMHFNFASADKIDSSDYVMYKLILNSTESESRDEYGSSSSSKKTDYWNIAFYNTATGKYHLLDETKKMIVNIATDRDDDDKLKSDSLLYYDVTICDYNKNGELDDNDPTYLFTSNKSGYNFKQVSPDNLSVKTWRIVPSTGKLLMQTVKDTNGDRKFDNDDDEVPYVYDLRTKTPAKEVFNLDIKQNIRELKQKFWKKKK